MQEPVSCGFASRRPAIDFVDTTMATRFRSFTRTPLAAALLGLVAAAQAQTTLSPVTVTGKAEPVPSVAGWGDVPLAQSPFQASIVDREQMRDRGVQRLADVVRL